jgi:hypothetical protein
MEKLWAGCINGAVSHHSARALPWVLKDSVLEQATLVAVALLAPFRQELSF